MSTYNLSFYGELTKIVLQLSPITHLNLSRVRRKPDFCICENKGAEQLRSYCAADQLLCFHYVDSTTPLLPAQAVLCG